MKSKKKTILKDLCIIYIDINIVNSTREISFNKAQYGLPGRVVCVSNYMYQHKTHLLRLHTNCKELHSM